MEHGARVVAVIDIDESKGRAQPREKMRSDGARNVARDSRDDGFSRRGQVEGEAASVSRGRETQTFRVAVDAVLVVLVAQHLRQQILTLLLDLLGALLLVTGRHSRWERPREGIGDHARPRHPGVASPR